MRKLIVAALVIFLSGCVEHSMVTHYAALSSQRWDVVESGTLQYRHKWESGAALTVYLRTIDGNADLLFQLEAPEGVTISAPDLKTNVQSADKPETIIAPEYIRRVDYISSNGGDYEVVYSDLSSIDGLKGATLHRPKAWQFRKLPSRFEWGAIAKCEGAKVTLRLPNISINNAEFRPEPITFQLVTDRVVTGTYSW